MINEFRVPTILISAINDVMCNLLSSSSVSTSVLDKHLKICNARPKRIFDSFYFHDLNLFRTGNLYTQRCLPSDSTIADMNVEAVPAVLERGRGFLASRSVDVIQRVVEMVERAWQQTVGARPAVCVLRPQSCDSLFVDGER